MTMTSRKWRKTTGFLLLCGVFAVAPVLIRSQEAGESSRKLVARRATKFPELARKMNITGSVKLEVTVAPNGLVKSITVRGGHPVLAQSAQDSVRDWKWEPASHETHEMVEVKFDTPQ